MQKDWQDLASYGRNPSQGRKAIMNKGRYRIDHQSVSLGPLYERKVSCTRKIGFLRKARHGA